MLPTENYKIWPALLALAVLAAVCAVPAEAGKRAGPCPQIQFSGSEKIELNPMEARLVCGDAATEGWGQIPFNQAESFLRAFLQQRGYQEPGFEPGQDVLRVDPGKKTIVKSFTVTGLPPEIKSRTLRKIKGQPMTPALLDAAKAALLGTLQNRGYACPAIEMQGNGTTGELSAEVRPGDVYVFAHIRPQKTDEVYPQIFSRYEAFRRGQRFDSRLLDLTARRTMADSLFLNAYFEVDCSTAGMVITERVTAGKPQLYRLGVGFDTEGFFIGKAQWQHSRLGTRSNSMGASVYTSFREQTAVANFRYYMGRASRLYLMPKLTFGRQNEPQYEAMHAEFALLPGFSWDTKRLRGEFSAGPALEYEHTIRGLGPVTSYPAFETQLELRDHLFEYYAGEPQAGGQLTFKSQSRIAGLESRITAHLLSLQGEHIWNLGGYSPPALILATRYLVQTTLVKNSLLAAGEIPLGMRIFMGGDSDLRGAELNKIPADSAGLLTTVYDGVELRMGDVFPHGLQPLIFLDAAMAGRSSAHLDPNVYFSPGFGLRWASPIGSLRATLARGMVWRRDPAAEVLMTPQWRLFLSLGKEF
ncbi:MAG: BamA/TamA family outer membrane protein [Elusimicrobiales bacterium]|nr:BamA/TamA family outer membrane protein [Elusimicrobiales bacterium]